LDDASKEGIARLRFEYPREQQFREFLLERNLPRARFATAIYLGMVLVVTAINLLGGMAPLGDSLLQPIYLLRLGVACPALILILCATYSRRLQPYYQWIASTGVIVTGVSVMAISGIAAAAGLPQFQMGDVLIIVYATLFVGLLARFVVTVAIALVTAFVTLGVALGVSTDDLIFAGVVLFATALMAVLSALRVERLLRTNFVETQRLAEVAERDGLTGLYNRRMFDTLTRRLWQQAQRDGQSLQVILVDIDHFKRFNDLYGHQAGDDCIRRVANVIARAAKRPFDFCARYGGEEFALILYGPSTVEPEALPEQIRKDIMACGIPHEGSSVGNVITVSVGSAIASAGAGRSLAGLIQKADEALYRAKQLGRNRALHTDADYSDTPTGAFKVFAVK
jgi:diguanylate cyclase (GGDEF)-like protein